MYIYIYSTIIILLMLVCISVKRMCINEESQVESLLAIIITLLCLPTSMKNINAYL